VIKMIAIILTFWALTLSACSSKDIGSEQPSSSSTISAKSPLEKPKSNYKKPGAAVDFEHNYDGKSKVGEIDSIQLSFTEFYDNGQMRVMLNADKELNLKPAQQDFLFSMDSQQTHELAISVEPQAEGKYYLNVFTSVLTDNLQQPKTRVFAIAFYIGNQGQQKSSQKSPSENVIILPSQETIVK
jgi:hypothetical protein